MIAALHVLILVGIAFAYAFGVGIAFAVAVAVAFAFAVRVGAAQRSAPALALASLALGCARVDLDDVAADAGSAAGIVTVSPEPGEVPPRAQFTLSFSAAMDEATLVGPSGSSDTVVLATEANQERAGSAIERGRVTASERKLFVAAKVAVEQGGRSLILKPERPLEAGVYGLLVSGRLRDAAGRKLLDHGARFRFRVGRVEARASLLVPVAGSQAPLNLDRVWARTASAGVLSVVGPRGAIAEARSGAGVVELSLCPQRRDVGCAALRPGETYALALDGEPSGEAIFEAAACAREAPPSLQAKLSARDDSISAQVVLDGPARVRLEVRRAEGRPEGSACELPGCRAAEALVACVADPCAAPGRAVDACVATLRVGGLASSTEYVAGLVAEDGEGHVARTQPERLATVAPLPHVVISELMIAPPGPLPRSAGEYVEILNRGSAPADVSELALAGADGRARPLLGSAPPMPVLLPPNGRALAVGASFDAARYPSIPEGTPILRAGTQRLLGHGLHHRPPRAVSLLFARKNPPIELSRFPGGGPACPDGASIEASQAHDGWRCGAVGGSPGRPP